MHSDINVCGLNCIKSATGTTIVKVCSSPIQNTLLNFLKNWGF